MIQPIPTPTPPSMGVGAILDTTLKIYRSQFGRFFLISLRAYAWMFAIITGSTVALFGMIAILFIALGRQDSTASYLIVGLAVFASAIARIGFYFFSIAKHLANSALISKLTYNILSDSTESPSQATESVRQKTWAFFRISLYISIAYFLLYIGFWILGGILTLISAVFLGLASAGDLAVAISLIIFAVVYILGVLSFFIWLFARWFIPEVVLAVENISGAADSIGRSWELSKSSVLRLILVAFIGFLITTPITAIVPFLPAIVTGGFDTTDPLYQSVALLATLLNLFVSLAILPFWQTLKGVLYFDLRARSQELAPMSVQTSMVYQTNSV